MGLEPFRASIALVGDLGIMDIISTWFILSFVSEKNNFMVDIKGLEMASLIAFYNDWFSN